MELTRRDAVAALAALGVTGGVAVGVSRRTGDSGPAGDGGSATGDDSTAGEGGDCPAEAHVRATMQAVATVVYPGEVSGIEEFVDGFLDGRLDGSAHARELRETVGELDDLARSWYGARVVELGPETRDTLLREVGADLADEDPYGTTAERARYFVVNDLLLALYASPAGGKLVGIENPRGHPGGTESYTQGPP